MFQKSAGAKKYPPNQSRAMNPYVNLEIAPPLLPPSIMQLGDPTAQYGYGRNYITGAELAELNRVLRVGGGGGSTHSINLSMQPQFNYPPAGGCFTISGLNLNLGAGGAASQPVLRPMPPPVATTMTIGQQDITSSVMASTIAPETAYGAEINNNANGPSNRFMNMDHCMDLENYWPTW